MSIATESDEPIHLHFGLSYCTHLTLERTFLQSMPVEWQRKFVAMLEELDDAFEHVPTPERYRVTPSGGTPVPHYNRGRTRIEPKLPISK